MGPRGAHDRIRDDLATGRLLLITKPGSASAGSPVPFRDALVVETDTPELPDIEGEFDAAAIDHTLVADVVLGRVVEVLRPGAAIIIFFPANHVDVVGVIDPASLQGLDGKGLRWVAIEANRQTFCVTFRLTQTPSTSMAPTSSQVSMVCEAFRLGADHWHGIAAAALSRLDAAASEIDNLVDGRRRSEQALLDHVEALLHALNLERRAHRDLKAAHAVLERRLIGRRIWRSVQRAVRPVVRAGVTLSHGQLPGRNRIRHLGNRIRATRRAGTPVSVDQPAAHI
jgi:hypothetical protein